MKNPRTRGKIAHSEWAKIAERHSAGESLASLARAYSCTPPAIRYIVERTGRGSLPAAGERAEANEAEGAEAVGHAPRAKHRTGGAGIRAAGRPITEELWSRINNDIASFLVAMDALLTADTHENREELLNATDRLLRASARTRVELERSRRPSLAGTLPRRTFGAELDPHDR